MQALQKELELEKKRRVEAEKEIQMLKANK
jgi:hypothetical protein